MACHIKIIEFINNILLEADTLIFEGFPDIKLEADT